MSGMLEALVEQLARFDDEAFVALANRGLLRRAQKDLGKTGATVVEEADDALVVALGEHRIRFDRRGPAFAQCSCPATGVCQHILVAALSLQRKDAAASDSSVPSTDDVGTATPHAASASPAVVPDATPALHAMLAGIPTAVLIKHAGKAGYRWACQFVQDLDLERNLSVSGDRYIVIGFAHPRMTFRYLGGGIETLIADIQVSAIEKYQVAAVLAYRRASQLAIEPPEAPGKPRSASLDLGKDHELATDSADTLNGSRQRLLASVNALLTESVTLGLSHLSDGIRERFATTATWAQGAEYHRLALLLRRIADHIEMLLERAGAADEHRLLDELALAYGLVAALSQAASGGRTPVHLVGRARTKYQGTGTLQLFGLGATAWRSGSGYVGLTMMFWSTEDRSFMSCTDARPEVQRGFNPVARYTAAGPWNGLGAPSMTTGRQLTLNNAELNAQGRLSSTESTSATVQQVLNRKTLVEALKPCSDWSMLDEFQSARRTSLLAEPDPMSDWAVLAPARWGTPEFDAARQTLVVQIFDGADRPLTLALAYSDYTRQAISHLERFGEEPPDEGTLIIGRLRPGADGQTCEPLSLIVPDVSRRENPVVALHFDPLPSAATQAGWLSRLLKRSSSTEHSLTLEAPVRQMPVLPPELRAIRHELQRCAERGVNDDSATKTHAALSDLRAKGARAGLSIFSGPLRTGESVSALVLEHHYLCLQAERLLAGSI